jgi:hypothetical protein
MHPLDRAAAWHAARSPAPFDSVLIPHLHHGTAIFTPTHLLLARRVSSEWDQDTILDPAQVDPAGDTLHLWLLIGTPFLSLAGLFPSDIRFLSYHRGPRFILRPFPHRK